MPPRRLADRKAASTAAPSTNETTVDSTTISARSRDTPGQTQDAAASSLTRSGSSSSIRRSDTLQRPNLPQSASPSSSTTTRGGSRPTARPRGIGRRSQHGRAELEKAELQRKQAEAASKPPPKPWQNRRDSQRGHGAMRGRMRGGYVGENERRSDGVALASGPFSLGQVTRDTGRRSHAAGGREGGAGTGGGGAAFGSHRSTGGPGGSRGANASSSSGARVKQELRSNGDAVMTDVHIKQEDGGYISSDADDERSGVRKLNIDTLVDLTGDDEDDVVYLPPVRVQRIEHKERTLVANADGALRPDGTVAATEANDVAALNASERRRAKQRSKDVEIQRVAQRYKGTYTDSSSSEDEVQVKQENRDDTRAQQTVQSPPTSPDTRRRLKGGIKNDSTADQHHRPSFQTKEEELEWEIRQRDMRILRAELGQLSLPPAEGETLPDASTADDPRADKMYLFQFPAILPTLVPVKPKQEDEDIVMQDLPEAGSAAKPVGSKPDVKPPPVHKRAADIPSGMVGKLRVHKSGRAFLDWGGIPMEVSMGQEASFLQDVVIIDSREAKPEADREAEQDRGGGTAMSMGQVKGRFVVVPQWDAIFDQLY